MNDLSADGLSRGEIRKVYRDIKTGSFTFNKTAEVIKKSVIKSSVGGYEIFQDDPTPEDLENLWKYKTNNGRYLIQNLVKEGWCFIQILFHRKVPKGSWF